MPCVNRDAGCWTTRMLLRGAQICGVVFFVEKSAVIVCEQIFIYARYGGVSS